MSVDAEWLDWWRIVGPDRVAHLATATMAPGTALCDHPGHPADLAPHIELPGQRRWPVDSMCGNCVVAAGGPRAPVQDGPKPAPVTYTIEQAEAIIRRRDATEACGLTGHRPYVFTYDMTGVCECGEWTWSGRRTGG